jgi:hypothetical protein
MSLEKIVMELAQSIEKERELESRLAITQRLIGDAQIETKKLREKLFKEFPELAAVPQTPTLVPSTVIQIDDGNGPPPPPKDPTGPGRMEFSERSA